jgi:hypothetical protein
MVSGISNKCETKSRNSFLFLPYGPDSNVKRFLHFIFESISFSALAYALSELKHDDFVSFVVVFMLILVDTWEEMDGWYETSACFKKVENLETKVI